MKRILVGFLFLISVVGISGCPEGDIKSGSGAEQTAKIPENHRPSLNY